MTYTYHRDFEDGKPEDFKRFAELLLRVIEDELPRHVEPEDLTDAEHALIDECREAAKAVLEALEKGDVVALIPLRVRLQIVVLRFVKELDRPLGPDAGPAR